MEQDMPLAVVICTTRALVALLLAPRITVPAHRLPWCKHTTMVPMQQNNRPPRHRDGAPIELIAPTGQP